MSASLAPAFFARNRQRIFSIFGLAGLTLLITAVLLLLAGINPLAAYLAILQGAFGSTNALAEDLVYATPITFTALSVILGFRCGLWNIGADGQLYLGAIAAVGIGFNTCGIPGPLLIPAMALGAFAAGAGWAAIAAFLKLRFGANEVIVTIMLNFLAVTISVYLIGGPWASGITPATGPIAGAGFLPVLIPGTRVNADTLLAVACALILAVVLRTTVAGYRIRAVGQNPHAARHAGMHVKRIVFGSFAAAGGIAGLAGFGEVAGIYHNLPNEISPGYGFTGIIVALLARLDPLWAMLVAFLLAALNVGAGGMQRALGVPVSLVNIITAVLILLVLAMRLLERRQ
jgi:simple sugar transport system permease protein